MNRRRADRRRAGVFAAAVLLATFAGPAGVAAAVVEDLYQAQTIVTGQGEANRMVGFARCLEDVLVKVSGDPRLIGDPRLAPLTGEAAPLVTGFSYYDRMSGIPVHDEQGTRDRPYDLTVTFDRDKVDAAVRSLGLAPWGASRPRLVVFAGLRNGAVIQVLSSDGDGDRGRDRRDALFAAAAKRGLPIALPSAAALAGEKLDFVRLQGAGMARLDALARRNDGDMALAGRLVWVERPLGWTAQWRIAWQGTTYRWRITGVSFDDAFRNAMEGAEQIMSGHGRPKN
jgi:uncharacterized protein